MSRLKSLNPSAVMLALLPLVCCTHLADAVETPKLAFALLILAWCWARHGVPLRLPRRPLMYCAGGFWLATSVSYFSQGLPDGGMGWVEATVAMAFLWLWAEGRAGRPRDWTAAALWGWWGSALYSWVQRLRLDPLDWSNPSLSVERTIAGLGNPDFLGFYLALLAPLAWVQCNRPGSSSGSRVAANLAWLLAIATLVLTGTRGAWLAVAAAALVMLAGILLRYPRLRGALLGTCLLLAVGLPIVYQMPVSKSEGLSVSERAGNLLNPKEQSLQARFALWRIALRETYQRPILGWGPGWYPYRALLHSEARPMALRIQEKRPENPHNQYLEILFNSGLVGITLYLAVGLLAMRYAWREAGEHPEGLALLAGLMAYAVNSGGICATFALQILVVWMIAWCEQPSSPQETVPSPPRELVAGRLLGIVLTLSAVALLLCESLMWDVSGLLDPYRNNHLSPPSPAILQKAYQLNGDALGWAPWWRRKTIRLALLQPDSAASLQQLDQLTQRYPEDASLWAGLAGQRERLLDLVPLKEVTSAWSQAITLDPYNPVFHFHFSRWLWRTKDFSGALREADTSLALYPVPADSSDGPEGKFQAAQLFQRALCLHSAEQDAEAETAWRDLQTSHPKFDGKKPW